MNEEKIIARYKEAGIEIPEEFYDAKVINMLGSDNIFEWNGKKYSFLGCSFAPTITMKNTDDKNDTISFAITSELKNELVLINPHK